MGPFLHVRTVADELEWAGCCSWGNLPISTNGPIFVRETKKPITTNGPVLVYGKTADELE
jgi:hypothetical protein